MNPKIIHRSTSRARKEYDDDGWDYVVSGLDKPFPGLPLTNEEQKMMYSYVTKLKNPHKILKGELYERQFNTYEGTPYVWRTKKVFYDFLCKYDLFPDL